MRSVKRRWVGCTFCLSACFLIPLFLTLAAFTRTKAHESSVPNLIARRQIEAAFSTRSQSPPPIKALTAPNLPVTVLAEKLDEAESADVPVDEALVYSRRTAKIALPGDDR
jgi:hypothetical protein